VRDARLTAYAKTMRKEPSEPEQRLWLALRAKRFENVKFRRQKVIGRYIADFAARDPMLVIELDGDTHAGQEGYDEARTHFLQEQGYRVIRFSNIDVMTNLEGVLLTIASAVATSPLPTLSPEGERAKQ
jgi:very-short-patch-repair endonuclease